MGGREAPGRGGFWEPHDPRAFPPIGYSPLGGLSYKSIGLASDEDNALVDPEVLAIAEETQQTPAQVMLRYQLQRGLVVIPKSTKVHRLKENLDVYGFHLDDGQVARLKALDRNRRFNDPGVFMRGLAEPGTWMAAHGLPIFG